MTLQDAAQLLAQQFQRLFLEQIALRVRLQGREQMPVIDVNRGDDNDRWHFEVAQSRDDLYPVTVRQPQIHQCQVERLGA